MVAFYGQVAEGVAHNIQGWIRQEPHTWWHLRTATLVGAPPTPAKRPNCTLPHALPVVVPISSDSQTVGNRNALLDADIATGL